MEAVYPKIAIIRSIFSHVRGLVIYFNRIFYIGRFSRFFVNNLAHKHQYPKTCQRNMCAESFACKPRRSLEMLGNIGIFAIFFLIFEPP